MSVAVRTLRNQFIGMMVLFVVGWLVAGWIHPQLNEYAIRFGFGTWLLWPAPLPRIFGLVPLAVVGGMFVWDLIRHPEYELDNYPSCDDFAPDPVAGYAIIIFLVLMLIYGLAALIGYWTGAWVTMLGTVALAWASGQQDEPSLEAFMVFTLVIMAAVGPWTGFQSSLLHGLAFLAAITISAALRPMLRQSAPSPTPALLP